MELLSKTGARFLTALLALFCWQALDVSPALAMGKSSARLAPGFYRPEEIKAAPPFALKDLDGKTRQLADYRGKVVVVHFWASCCSPEEMKAVNVLRERFKDRGFEVLAITVVSKGEAEIFARKSGLEFPVLVDPYGTVMRDYRVLSIPASFLINREGKIEGVAEGHKDWSRLEVTGAIEDLLAR